MTYLLRLRFALVALLALPSTSARNIRGTNLDVRDVSQEPMFMASNRYLITEGRRLIAHEGVMRTLIIRVTDGEGKQIVDQLIFV